MPKHAKDPTRVSKKEANKIRRARRDLWHRCHGLIKQYNRESLTSKYLMFMRINGKDENVPTMMRFNTRGDVNHFYSKLRRLTKAYTKFIDDNSVIKTIPVNCVYIAATALYDIDGGNNDEQGQEAVATEIREHVAEN
jgi:hypothetical protein